MPFFLFLFGFHRCVFWDLKDVVGFESFLFASGLRACEQAVEDDQLLLSFRNLQLCGMNNLSMIFLDVTQRGQGGKLLFFCILVY